MPKLLLLPLLCSALSTLPAMASDCSAGSADERFACLQQQTCPDASTDAELLSCYRTISMTLLAQGNTTPAPVQRITATQPGTAAPAAVAPASAAPAPVQSATATATATAPAPATAAVAGTQTAAPVTTADDTSPDSDPTANFGLQNPPSYVIQKQVEPDEISAVIVQALKQPRGNYLIVLNNGQLWEETEPTRSILKTGQSVKIIKRLMNAYKLVPDKGRSTNVSRIPCYQDDTDKRCALLASAPRQP